MTATKTTTTTTLLTILTTIEKTAAATTIYISENWLKDRAALKKTRIMNCYGFKYPF